MSEELRVIAATYDLLLWTHGRVQGFPRASRFSTGLRMEQKFHDLLQQLLSAKYASRKEEYLCEAALNIEHLRYLFRICKDTRVLAIKSHAYAVDRLLDIGAQVHAWRKYASDREKSS